jgi:hypothetical protein
MLMEEIHPLTKEVYTKKSIVGEHVYNSQISEGLYERLIEAGVDKGRIDKYYVRVPLGSRGVD